MFLSLPRNQIIAHLHHVSALAVQKRGEDGPWASGRMMRMMRAAAASQALPTDLKEETNKTESGMHHKKPPEKQFEF